MTEPIESYDADTVRQRIVTLRDRRVILSSDLAAVYGVPVKALNQAVKRNAERFPEDFVFQLTREDAAMLASRSQTVTLKRGQNVKHLYQKIRPLLLPPPDPEHKRIGFGIKDRRARYNSPK